MKASTLRLNNVELGVLAQGVAQQHERGAVLPPGPLKLVHALSGKRVFVNGWHSWSRAGWLQVGERWLPEASLARRPMVDHPASFVGDDRLRSCGMAAVGNPEGDALLIGSLGPGGTVTLSDGFVGGMYEGDPSPWFVAYGSAQEVFADYVDILGKHLRVGRSRFSKAPRVWSSWYSFFRDISEEKLLQVLEGLRGLPFDVVQIDDGWQEGIGDWAANERFPRGLERMSVAIRKAGFTPGIWLAPFIARADSRLTRRRPEWLLRDAKGDPVVAGDNWGGVYYALDITRTDVCAWLCALLEGLRAQGYGYLKIDFVYAGAMPGQGGTGGAAECAYRQALGMLREAWGGGFLLVSGGPIIASLGLCDGLRVGPDVAPYWADGSADPTEPGTGNAVSTSANRLWLRPLVHTDPDVVFFRSRYNLMSEEQNQVLRDLATVASTKGTSDPPHWLDEEERTAMRAYFSEKTGVTQQGFHRFAIDGRAVDFARYAA